jgi:pimeloyl-ACP methyl ester carboxylesterase
LERTDFRDSLARIRTPTLVIAGAWDPLIGPRWSRALEVGLPDSRLVHFANSAHLPHLEEPDTFRRIVAEFLLR